VGVRSFHLTLLFYNLINFRNYYHILQVSVLGPVHNSSDQTERVRSTSWCGIQETDLMMTLDINLDSSEVKITS